MIIGVDIDDTLSHFVEPNIQTALKYINENNLNCKMINNKAYYFAEMFDWSREDCNKFWTQESDNMIATAPVRENASDVIKRMRNNGHKVIIITARSKEFHTNPYQISVDWLKKNDIPYDELLIGYKNKANICLEKKVDLFIDDSPQVLREIKEKGIDTLLMKNFHNDFVTDLRLVSNWSDIEDYIKNNF